MQRMRGLAHTLNRAADVQRAQNFRPDFRDGTIIQRVAVQLQAFFCVWAEIQVADAFARLRIPHLQGEIQCHDVRTR
jgi:hypothetical protein